MNWKLPTPINRQSEMSRMATMRRTVIRDMEKSWRRMGWHNMRRPKEILTSARLEEIRLAQDQCVVGSVKGESHMMPEHTEYPGTPLSPVSLTPKTGVVSLE